MPILLARFRAPQSSPLRLLVRGCVLKDAGLLTERRKRQRRLYRTRPEGLAGVRVFLDQFRDDD
jgi:DNA-binding transcriptional ArsR family regulator